MINILHIFLKGVICNYLTNQWKNFTCETEATSTESKLCQEMLKMTSEETISNDCQDVCVKKVDNEMADGRICFSLYLAIQSSTPKLGENGHGLPPPKKLLGENGHGLPPQKMLLGSENRQDMPPKIDNNNEQKLDEYNIDDENEGTFNDFFGFLKKIIVVIHFGSIHILYLTSRRSRCSTFR